MCAVVQVLVYISTTVFFLLYPLLSHTWAVKVFSFCSFYWFSMRFFSSSSSSSVEARRIFIHSFSLFACSCFLPTFLVDVHIFFSRLLCTIFTHHHHHQHRRRHIIGMRWCDSKKILRIYSRVKCEIATYRKIQQEKIGSREWGKKREIWRSKRETRQKNLFLSMVRFSKKI